MKGVQSPQIVSPALAAPCLRSLPRACRKAKREDDLPACRLITAATAAAQDQLAREENDETYLGEKFVKAIPQATDSWVDADIEATPIKIQYQDHSAIGVSDVDKSIKFYTKVLGFQQLARPGFPFGGAWLKAGNLVLHLIERDPTVTFNDTYEKEGATSNPEPWHIRRMEHKAFQVENLEKTEETLSKYGVEYHKFLVPETNAAQIFLYDPDHNGIELGANYAEIQKLIDTKGKNS